MPGEVTGVSLHIEPDLITKLNTIDEKLKSIDTSSKNVADNFKSAFGGTMSTNIGKVADNLERVRAALAGMDMSKLKVGDFGMTTTSMTAADSSVTKMASDISTLVGTINKLSTTLETWTGSIGKVKTASKGATVDIDALKAKLSTLDPKTMNIAGLTTLINDLQSALRKTGVPDKALEQELVRIKQMLIDIRKVSETSKDTTRADAERQITQLMQERLRLTKELYSLEKTSATNSLKGVADSAEMTARMEKIKARVREIEDSVTKLQSAFDGVGKKAIDAFDIKKTEQFEKKVVSVAEALRRVNDQLSKKDQTDLSKAKTEYERLLSQITQTEIALKKFNETKSKGGLTVDVSSQLDKSITSANERLNEMSKRKRDLESQYGSELVQIAHANEVKKGQVAIREHEKAEREKTAATRRAVDERYRAESHRMQLESKLQAMDLRARAAAEKERRLNEGYVAREKEIERLRAQIAGLDKTDKDYATTLATLQSELTKLINAQAGYGRGVSSLESKKKSLINTASQLRNMLLGMFSVSAIKGYIQKIVDVRAQFELQNVALRAILQNKDEADRIFLQVQQMALQSPFSIMQMNTYVKQLAAYRIESEKLVGTTKMLADVSAGLGVDMQRLILAYGQVKSANYLRATEVRQFTEAGLNIAGELAQYFSELQGKMISVGDVMEMITKRMVRFEDVEEVFKRVTSAGGLFYDMQKKQAETLWGQMQRLGDAISIMMNDIGQSNQSTISGVISFLRDFIKNWRVLATIIKTVVYSVGTYYAAILLAKIATGQFAAAIGKSSVALKMQSAASLLTVKNLEKIVIAAKKAAASLRGWFMNIMSAGLWGAAAVAVGAFVYRLIQVHERAEQIKEDLANIAAEADKTAREDDRNYRSLALIVSSANASYEERKEALEELNRTYGNILPKYALEEEHIKSMAGNYDAVTEALKAYHEEQARTKTIEYREKTFSDQLKSFVDSAQGKEFGFLGGMHIEDILPDSSRAKMAEILEQSLREGAEKGFKDVDEYFNQFLDNVESFYGVGFTDAWRNIVTNVMTANRWFYDDFIDLVDATNQLADAQSNVGLAAESRNAVERVVYTNAQNQVDELSEHVKSLETAFSNAANAQKTLGEDWMLTEKGQEVATALSIALQPFGLLISDFSDLNDTLSSNQSVTEATLDIHREALAQLIANLKESPLFKSGENLYFIGWVERLEKELASLQINDVQKDILKLRDSLLKTFNLDPSALGNVVINFGSTVSSVTKDVKGEIDTLKERIKSYYGILAAGGTVAEAMFRSGLQGVVVDIEAANTRLKFLEKFWALLGGTEKQKKTPKGRDIWSERLSLMQKVNKEYEKLLKYYDAETAKNRILKSFRESVAETFKGTQWANISQWGNFDDQATIDNLKKLAEKAGKEARKKILEAVGVLQAELDIKIREEGIQRVKDDVAELFDNLELTKTIGAIGVPIEMITMFGGKVTKLKDIRDYLTQQLTDLKLSGGNEELVKFYEDQLRKVTDLENKNQIERFKNYVAATTEAVAAAAQIQIKANREVNKIMNDETLDEWTKQQRIQRIIAKMNADLQKQAFQDFQASDVYVNAFADIEHASKQSLEYVISRLREMKDAFKDMPADQVRAIVNQLEKAESALREQSSLRDAFKNLKTAIQYARQRNELQAEQIRLTEQLNNLNQQATDQEIKVNALRQKRDSYKQGTPEWDAANQAYMKQAGLLDGIKNLIKQIAEGLGIITEEIEEGEDAMSDWTVGLGKAAEWARAMGDAIHSVREGLESMINLSPGMSDAFDVMEDVTGGVTQTLEGLASIDIKNPISWITGGAKAIGGLMKTIGAFFSIGDKKKERQILRLQDSINSLTESYEKLAESIENAYTYDDYELGYAQAQQNLAQQRANLEAMINLEKDKKKSDSERIKQWEAELDEIAKKEKELREQRITAQGGFGTDDAVRSAAESFVEVWLDAYRETGVGLDALGDKWDEFMQNLFVKQAAMKYVASRYKKAMDIIDNAIDTGYSGEDLRDAIAEARTEAEAAKIDVDEYLKALYNAFGFSNTGELLLSELQKGIQNITEPQAAAIEAYLNSIRFAVYEHTNQLAQIIELLSAQYNGGDTPLTTYVKDIRDFVRDIRNDLRRVIVPVNAASSNTHIVKVG